MSQQSDNGVIDGETMREFSSLAPSTQELINAAIQVRKVAYCVYSTFAVGAAIRSASGQIFTGCNVENGAYGPAICAERTAIAKAVSAGHRSFTECAVVAYQEHDFTSPCGVCRQTLSEFTPADRDIPIYLAKPSPLRVLCTSLCTLLPHRYISDSQRQAQQNLNFTNLE